MVISESQLLSLLGSYYWPFLRIVPLVLVAPVFGVALVPARVRVVIALLLTAVIAPVASPAPDVGMLSGAGVMLAAQQFVIGLAMGLALRLVFDGIIIGAQMVAMSMGLGFATMVDPQRGVSVPVLSQYFVVVATLLFLSLDGHLRLIEQLAASFDTLPLTAGGLGRAGFWELAEWGSRMFAGAIQVALPAVVALLVVNLAFGVMSRAAPTLNLFAIGFPAAMTLGFVILWLSLPNLTVNLVALVNDSGALVDRLLAGSP